MRAPLAQKIPNAPLYTSPCELLPRYVDLIRPVVKVSHHYTSKLDLVRSGIRSGSCLVLDAEGKSLERDVAQAIKFSGNDQFLPEIVSLYEKQNRTAFQNSNFYAEKAYKLGIANVKGAFLGDGIQLFHEAIALSDGGFLMAYQALGHAFLSAGLLALSEVYFDHVKQLVLGPEVHRHINSLLESFIQQKPRGGMVDSPNRDKILLCGQTVLFNKARQEMVKGNHREAERLFLLRLEDDPDHIGSLGRLCYLYNLCLPGRYSSYLECFKHLESLSPEWSRSVLAMISAHRVSKNIQKRE